jgi:hypothetical protein
MSPPAAGLGREAAGLNPVGCPSMKKLILLVMLVALGVVAAKKVRSA